MSKFSNRIFLMVGSTINNKPHYDMLHFAPFRNDANLRDRTGSPILNPNLLACFENVDSFDGSAELVIGERVPTGFAQIVREKLYFNHPKVIYIPGYNIVINCGVGTFEEAPNESDQLDVNQRNIQRVEQMTGIGITNLEAPDDKLDSIDSDEPVYTFAEPEEYN